MVGRFVSILQEDFDSAKAMLVSILGVTQRDANDELNAIRGLSIRMEWLCFKFFNITDADTEAFIKYAARAYFLYLVGCTIFSDKSRTRVSILYLRLFADLGSVSSYAWRAGALAYLYRQLSYALRAGVRQIVRYLPILEEFFRAHLNNYLIYHANI